MLHVKSVDNSFKNPLNAWTKAPGAHKEGVAAVQACRLTSRTSNASGLAIKVSGSLRMGAEATPGTLHLFVSANSDISEKWKHSAGPGSLAYGNDAIGEVNVD